MENTMQPDKPKRRRTVVSGDAQTLLLKAVDELFYQEGARAVGVEAVIRKAGVNKMSLYRQFSSKDALLMEYLKRRDERYWLYMEASLAKHDGQPRKQLLQIFTDFVERAAKSDYRGCPFVNIAVEFTDASHPARILVAENKQRLLALLSRLAEASRAKDPPLLAAGLALLLEGAYTATQTYGFGNDLIRQLPTLAEQMIAQA